MSLSTASLQINPVTLTFSPANPSTVTVNGAASCPFTLSNITYLQTYNGTFTPANNILNIFTAGSVQPSVMYCVFDQPMAITAVTSQVDPIMSLPVQKSMLITFSNLTYPVTSLFLEGRTTQEISSAVQQGVACNYFILLATATVT